MVYFIFFIFCRSICHPQTIIRRPPHMFCCNRVSSMMIPSPLTLTFGWLLHLTSKRQPRKAETPSLSLFFDGSHFGAPSKRTSCGDREPTTGCLLWTHGDLWRQYLGEPLPYPWRERAKPLEGRVAVAHLDGVSCGLWVVGCGLWVVGCGLWVVGCGLWVVGCVVGLQALCLLQYPFCRPPRQAKKPKNDGDEMDPW
jgi:hypothetical protein